MLPAEGRVRSLASVTEVAEGDSSEEGSVEAVLD